MAKSLTLTLTFFVYSILFFSININAITIIPTVLHHPTPYQGSTPVTSETDLLSRLDPSLGYIYGYQGPVSPENQPAELLSASIYIFRDYPNSINKTDHIYAAQDSFVRGAIDAWAKHQHFVFRPDDVWFTILGQLGYWRGSARHENGSTVKGLWDNWIGKPTPPNNMWVQIAQAQNQWVQYVFKQRSKAKWLEEWVKPGFPTLANRSMGTEYTGEDMMAQQTFMADYKPSFEAMGNLACEHGFPSVSLLGEKSDWVYLASKLKRMEERGFGDEVARYARMLRPILKRFVVSFDRPNDTDIRLFWNDMVISTRPPNTHLQQTTDIITGWINSFHFWDASGNVLLSLPQNNLTLRYDNITYPQRKLADLPTAVGDIRSCTSADSPWASWDHNRAGMLAKIIKTGIPEGYEEAMKLVGFVLPPHIKKEYHSILSPEPIWMTHFQFGGDTGPCCSPKNLGPCGLDIAG